MPAYRALFIRKRTARKRFPSLPVTAKDTASALKRTLSAISPARNPYGPNSSVSVVTVPLSTTSSESAAFSASEAPHGCDELPLLPRSVDIQIGEIQYGKAAVFLLFGDRPHDGMPARINAAVFEPLHRPRKRQPAETKNRGRERPKRKAPCACPRQTLRRERRSELPQEATGTKQPRTFSRTRTGFRAQKNAGRKQSGTEIKKLPVRSVFGDA